MTSAGIMLKRRHRATLSKVNDTGMLYPEREGLMIVLTVPSVTINTGLTLVGGGPQP